MIKKTVLLTYLLVIIQLSFVYSQTKFNNKESKNFWEISGKGSIIWNVGEEDCLPHEDNIEMAGQKVAAIIYYTIDENKKLHIERDIIFPQLRTLASANENKWKKYRAYLRHNYNDDILPTITQNAKTLIPGPIDSVEIAGKLIFYHQPVEGIRIKRTFLPSMTKRFFVEIWELQNLSGETQKLQIGKTLYKKQQQGIKGSYTQKSFNDSQNEITLAAGEIYSFAIYFAAAINDEPLNDFNYKTAVSERDNFLTEMQENYILKTPNEVLNTLFYFSKIRAAENIFNSKMGLVHSPGGGNYYVGIWANDQAEYSGPFFPFLGYEKGNTAAYNCYRWFLKNIPEDYSPITSSFEMEGDLTCCGSDRGDAAMIAFGASQFALLRGDENIATELWPLIEWCLEYCHQMKNSKGVIRSTSDEMEGRISTGDANLATSSLYYGGLKYASYLSEAIDKTEASKIYNKRADELAEAIDEHFGANIEGLETYSYFDGYEYLRHWICLPLVMGINNRKNGTTEALLNKLWTENGVLVEFNPNSDQEKVFWDRGTLYALRGTFKAGATELSLEKLGAFSEKRLLGDHVPYVIEAYPENNMRHLSAESALYCRIFTEGLLGLEPTGFKSFTLSPYLPENWEEFSFENIKAFDSSVDIKIKREKNKLKVIIHNKDIKIFDRRVNSGEQIVINL